MAVFDRSNNLNVGPYRPTFGREQLSRQPIISRANSGQLNT